MRRKWEEPVAVLGYGEEGRSTLRHLLKWGYGHIRVLDRAEPEGGLPAGVQGGFGEGYLGGLRGARTAIRSPGVRPDLPEVAAFVGQGGLLTSQVEAAFELAGRRRLIGITGTVGKGTCCSLLSAMLGRGGISHRLAGNIGVPPLDVLEDLEPEGRLLLELSSFQLAGLKASPAVAVVLRTTSEHLDWHASRGEYWEHKANLTRFQEPGDLCVYFADAEGSAWIGAQGGGRKIPVGASGTVRIAGDFLAWPERDFVLRLDETRLVGSFNLENLAAAAAVALELGVPPEAARTAAREFQPLEHRLEFVGVHGGISYYNDSYATRPEAALAAVRALRGSPMGLILGGSEKFADFTELAAALAEEPHLRAIALIGQTAPRLESELRAAGALEGRSRRFCDYLPEALEFLRAEVPSPGVVLLSPACASFGLFANYKERGRAFKSWVRNLPGT